MSVEKGLFCGECKESCIPIVTKDKDVDPAWGQTFEFETYEIESNCCHADVFTRRELDETVLDDDMDGDKEYTVFEEATPEDCE